MTRILDRLEKKGMAVRQRDERDRRSQRIYLTEKGITVLDALMPLVKRYGAEAFAGIGAEERKTLCGLLARIEARLDAMLEPKDRA